VLAFAWVCSCWYAQLGAVEGWLNELVQWMQQTLKVVLEGAITDALAWDVDKPRCVGRCLAQGAVRRGAV
jgi:hypothetical protein